MLFDVLRDLLIVFVVGGAAIYLFHQLRVPAVVGLLVSGMIVGPYGLSLVGDVEDAERVQMLADIGVVVLLFTVGLEFSLSRLIAMATIMLRIGLPQVLVCIAVTVVATWSYYGAMNQAVFTGMLVAMSSTAIVVKILADRGELQSLHSRIIVAVLLLQDLLVIVFVLAVPLLAGGSGPVGPPGAAAEPQIAHEAAPVLHFESPWVSLAVGLAMVVGILAAGKYLIPNVLYKIVRTRNRELFLMAIFVICVGTAALTAWVGLSLSLGAFLAGLTLAESEYGHQTLAEVLPFRDTLSSLFFVSVGMLLDLEFVRDNAWLVVISVLGLVALKFASVALPALVSRYSLRTAVLAGLATAQIGEFSFVLAGSGLGAGLISPDHYQTFLAAAVLTMCLTPLLIAGGPQFVEALSRRPRLARLFDDRHLNQHEARSALKDHVIIAGYGLNGRNLAAALRELQIAYVVLETNPETVRIHRLMGESIMFGDCTRPAVLEHADIHHARSYVVGISDPVSTRRTVQVARQLNEQLRIIVRTRYYAEVDDLRAVGATEVIPEEFETSIEILARVLREYQVPGNVIRKLVSRIRADQYQAFRGEPLAFELVQLPSELHSAVDTETCLIEPGSPAVGKTISELWLRTQTGATVLAVRRGDQLITNPGGTFRFAVGDVAIVVGDHEQVHKAIELLAV